MEWVVQRGGDHILQLTLPAAFLDWLAERTRDPVVLQLDPYRDTVVDAGQQSAWLRVLREVRTRSTEALRYHHEARSHLPRDPAAREVILSRLVAQDLARDPHQRTLDDLTALLELAFDRGASVHVLGD